VPSGVESGKVPPFYSVPWRSERQQDRAHNRDRSREPNSEAAGEIDVRRAHKATRYNVTRGCRAIGLTSAFCAYDWSNKRNLRERLGYQAQSELTTGPTSATCASNRAVERNLRLLADRRQQAQFAPTAELGPLECGLAKTSPLPHGRQRAAVLSDGRAV
jgi:hypothetical protein